MAERGGSIEPEVVSLNCHGLPANLPRPEFPTPNWSSCQTADREGGGKVISALGRSEASTG